MKIFGYSRPRDFMSKDFSERFTAAAAASGMDYCVNESYARFMYESTGAVIPAYSRITPEDVAGGGIMIAIGGDGTFLEAVRGLRGLPMPIVGVNTGRLGFLAGISPSGLKAAFEEIKNGRYTLERRTMLTVEGDFGTTPEFPCALNEFTLHRHTADMIEVAAYADGHMLAVIRGDGTIVATPTGSTAYSMSAGGPIIAPDCGCFVCTAIAPHNFTIRPLVIPDSSVLSLEVRTRGRKMLASLDNSSSVVGDGARFTVKKAEFCVFVAQLQNISFYDTLRDRMMWGLDRRDNAQEKF